MRGIKSMLWNTSLLNPEKGITFHNKTINDLREKLPKNNNINEPLSESLLWFNDRSVPSSKDVNNLSEELYLHLD